MSREHMGEDVRPKRAGPVLYLAAGSMLVCLVYLVSMSIWALSLNISGSREKDVMASYAVVESDPKASTMR